MSAQVSAPTSLTTEEMFALPDNGQDRELIRGVLRELPMTKRSRSHGRIEANVSHFLKTWLDNQPEPRGQVVSGEVGFRLLRDPDTTVGVDVAFASAALVAQTPEAAPFFDGPPLLAVEILSPSDRQDRIDEKVALYLEAGTALVWVINSRFRTITVHRPGAEPEMINVRQELSAEPHLPGFRVPAARVFE